MLALFLKKYAKKPAILLIFPWQPQSSSFTISRPLSAGPADTIDPSFPQLPHAPAPGYLLKTKILPRKPVGG
jgi:hypothetical protein